MTYSVSIPFLIKNILLYVTGILALNYQEQVYTDLLYYENVEKRNNHDYEVVMEALADTYFNSQHWYTKRQLLSTLDAGVLSEGIKY